MIMPMGKKAVVHLWYDRPRRPSTAALQHHISISWVSPSVSLSHALNAISQASSLSHTHVI